jgi:prevent-host-death family protein
MVSPRTPSAPASAARGSFAEMLNRAAYGKERVVVTRRGKALAAIVPMEDMLALDALEDKRDAQLIAKRGAAWLRKGRRSSPIEKVEKKHRAKR